MKRNTFIFLAALAATTPAGAAVTDSSEPPERGEQIRYQLILPEEKAPEVVKPSEPNPFSKADNKTIKEDGASGEENRVREILLNLPVTGYADGGEDGPRVMLGPYKLRRNDYVPQVTPEQSVRLRVNSISKSQIDLIWVEKKNRNTGMPPRVVTIPVKVTTPKVHVKMARPVTPEPKGDGTGFYQYTASTPPSAGEMGSAGNTPPETRRATAADEGQQLTSKIPTSDSSGTKGAEDHPANLLMNMLVKSLNKAKPVDTAPPPAPQPITK